MEETIRVGSLAEVPENELRAFELPGGRVCVAHVGTGVFAVGDECTHQGCSLAEDGEITGEGDGIECTCHGSVFSLETGEALNGPALDPVPTYPVHVVDGWIEVGPAEAE